MKSHLRIHHRAHMPFPTLVNQLRLTRQPLLLTREFETRIGLRVRFQSHSCIECIAFGRPLDDPCAKLRDWPESLRVARSTMEWEVSICPRAATGIHCCLIIKLVDDVELLVCLGMDDTFRPFCIGLPLSHGVYNDLDERIILREYCRSAKRGYTENETVITD